jgi:hypothetical protein
MAKLVDALPSGGSVRKDVLVRIQFWARYPSFEGFFLFCLPLQTLSWQAFQQATFL